jgi:CDP-2,3-bis-(O-geranylgeranyl)-sn-glycerol synthase
MILKTIWFILPAYIANMMPLVCKKIKFLDRPLDFNKTFRNKRIFGNHKTIRGLLCAIIGCEVIIFLQFKISSYLEPILVLDYNNWFIVGLLFSIGAMMGDLIESFFKRQLNFPAGKKWFPFDQLDFIVGALLLISIVQVPPLYMIVILFLLTPLLHLLTNYIAYKWKIKDVMW